MKALRYIWKWMSQLHGPEWAVPNVVDSHKWESKLQIWACLSDRPR